MHVILFVFHFVLLFHLNLEGEIVEQHEKKKTDLYSKIMTNFEAFRSNVSSSIKLFFCLKSGTHTFISAAEGDILILACMAKTHFESCTFKHKGYKCEYKFEDSNDDQNPTPNCDSNLVANDAIKFIGRNYHKIHNNLNLSHRHCAIELKYVRLQHEGQWSCSTATNGKTKTTELNWLQLNQNSMSYITIISLIVTTTLIVIIGFGAIIYCYFFGFNNTMWNLKLNLTQCCRTTFRSCKHSEEDCGCFLKRRNNTSESDEPAYYVTQDFNFQNEPMPNVGGSSHEEIKFIRNTNDICDDSITVDITDYVVPRDDCTEEIPAKYDYVMTTYHKQN